MLIRAAQVSRLSPATIQLWTRTYMSAESPVVYPRIKGPRRYGEKKTFLYNQYSRILQASATSPIVILSYSDFSIPRLVSLRREIAAAASKHATKIPSLASPSPAPMPTDPQLPKLMFLKSSILGVVLREKDVEVAKQIADMVKGGLAILTLPDLNPPQLDAVLKAMSRAVPPRIPKTPEQIKLEKEELQKTFVPGRGVKRFSPDPIPELKVVGALIEGQVFKAEGLQDVAKLPNLDTIRAQLVGLLSAPAMQLAAVLSEASGGKLKRTLEGFKKSLEEGQSQDATHIS